MEKRDNRDKNKKVWGMKILYKSWLEKKKSK
jgi:hypothetical protein